MAPSNLIMLHLNNLNNLNNLNIGFQLKTPGVATPSV